MNRYYILNSKQKTLCIYTSKVFTKRFQKQSIYKTTPHIWQTGQCSQYSNSRVAGRSGVRTPMGVIFSKPIQTDPKDHPALYTMDTTSLSQVHTWGMALTTHPLLALSLSICRVTPLHTLCAGLVCNGRALPHVLADISLYICQFSYVQDSAFLTCMIGYQKQNRTYFCNYPYYNCQF